MLGVHRLASHRADYYLTDLAREIPVGDDGSRGTWIGQAALGLGLSGPVDPDQFRAVLAGCHPGSGRSMRSERATVHGYDLTFSAPKSASLLFGLGGPEVARHVVAGHEAAVQGAVAYLEIHGVTATRRRGADREVIGTSGVVAGAFTHGVNRNLDPHLHSHVVMANLVHGEDSRWSACDQRGISAHRVAAGAVYDAQLRMELTTRLGVAWNEAPLEQAEVRGIPTLAMGEFSSRSADIRRHMAEMGAHSARGNRIAWAVTRPAKADGGEFADLVADWDRRARGVSVGRSDISALFGQRVPAHPTLSEHQFASVLSRTPDGGARRRDVVTAFSVAAPHGMSAPSLGQLTDLWVPSAPHRRGVAEEVHQRREMVPHAHVARELGPRPVEPAAHIIWCTAAHEINGYRQRWGVTQTRDAWGVDGPDGLAGFSTPRLIDHLRSIHRVDEARTRLGRRAPNMLELDRGR